MTEPEAGIMLRDTVMLACIVLDCTPWFDFADLEVYASDDEAEATSTVST